MAREKKADNLVDTLLSIGRLGLMLIGILGIALDLFNDDGIFRTLLGKIFESTSSVVVTIIIGIMLYFFNRWLTTVDGKASKKGDIPLYAMMAVGAFFIYRFISTGSF